MKQNEISTHEVRFYLALERDKWKTSRELSEEAGIAYRTARMFAKKLTDLGVSETAKVFPGHRYRAAPGKNDYAARLKQAAKVFGLK